MTVQSNPAAIFDGTGENKWSLSRDEAVAIAEQFAVKFPKLTGQAHKERAGWSLQVDVPGHGLYTCLTREQRRTLWRDLLKWGFGPK